MTVTIHALATPAQTAHLTRHLVALAGGNKTAVRSGNGGLVVDDALALAYLSTTVPAPAPRQRQVSPDLDRLVRDAEGRGGLLESPTAQPAVEQPVQQTKTRRPRRKPVGAAS